MYRHFLLKFWIMSCLNLGSVQIIYRISLEFLNFVEHFKQNTKKSCKREWDSAKLCSLEPRLSVPDFVSQLWRKVGSSETKSGTENLGSRLEICDLVVNKFV